MTPAQLDALAEQHRRMHDDGRSRSGAQRGTTADLLALARMRPV